MFDIGFSELLLIAVVALIVIGPQRLPKVARTLGHLFGRMQRYVNDVKADIAREIQLDELKKMQSSMEEAARDMRDTVNREVSDAEKQLDQLTHDAQAPQPKIDPYDDPFADGTPSQAEAAASPQGELPLDANQPPAQKQA
ncbi:MAG: Sec-independent protein translocase protein TatB [Betaproteobacteria bacterium]|nr:Sec-independent protein translocase protein TatB [Betaproteobacteria bacterium]